VEADYIKNTRRNIMTEKYTMPEEYNDEKRSMGLIVILMFLIFGSIIGFIFGYLAKAYLFN